jgi:hypothetical protein
LAQTPQQAEALHQLLTNATTSSGQVPQQGGTPQETAPPAAPLPRDDHGFVSKGPHRFVVGVLKSVQCDPPNLNLTVTSQAKTLTLHAENYFKIQFTALFTPSRELEPCNDLEDRPARVEYVESADASDLPRLIAVELHK